VRSPSATGKLDTEKRGKSDRRTTAKTKRVAPRTPPARKPLTAAIGTPEPFPTRLAPMTAQIKDQAFSHPDWAFEPKLDGYRAIAYIRNGRATLLTRGGHDYSSYFPHLVRSLAEQPIQQMVLDGEIVAFQHGRPSFEALQSRVSRRMAALPRDPAHCVLFCFDILHLAGTSTRALPYSERRKLLLESVAPSVCVQIVHADEDGIAMYEAALATGLEGVIAKRKGSLYVPAACAQRTG
jgi:bifunctional non-homologous end joining protein LigD